MAKFFLACILVIFSLSISCSSHTEKKTTENVAAEPLKNVPKTVVHHFMSIKRGEIINQIKCKQDTNETYCAYLPKGYDTAKSWPVIYFFDAHARGKLPVTKYQDLAEKNGMIFIASNNSQNGLKPEAYETIVNDLFSNTLSAFNIDEKRIIVAGFSGGAKVAGAAAIQNGNVSSVIGCAAPMDVSKLGGAYFNYAGIVGKGDFNYWDMVKLDGYFNKTPIKHQLFTFDGIHEWPDKAAFAKAIDFVVQASGNKSTNTPNKINAINEEKEESTRNGYVKSFQSESADHWLSEISKLYDGYHNSKNDEVKWMDRRLLSFINMMSYLKIMDLLNGKHFDDAASFLRVFKASDPANPDGPFLTADYYALNGQKDKAIASLNEAVKLGYDDLLHFAMDPMLTSIHNEPGFLKIYEKLSK